MTTDTNSLNYLNEPTLTFGHDQDLTDPRDGLTLFGPFESRSVFGIAYGVIGTAEGIEFFKTWVNRISKPLYANADLDLWVPYPGFEAAFGIPFPSVPVAERKIDSTILLEILQGEDNFQRVHKTADLYIKEIKEFYNKGDQSVKLWFVVSPEQVFKTCRPKSRPLGKKEQLSTRITNKRKLMAFLQRKGQVGLLEDLSHEYEVYSFDADFRRQLKARLIIERVMDPVQIVRETTLVPDYFKDEDGELMRELQPPSQVAWNLSSTVFYKAGGKPWKLHGVRKGVCYLGMVYKKTDESPTSQSACCAAQMFLDSGDGVVFSGAVGPWKSLEGEDYHLSADAARQIIQKGISAYQDLCSGNKPEQVFVHGRTYFNDKEWSGFSDTGDSNILVTGIRIRKDFFRLFRNGKYPMLRGLALIESARKGFLWTTGFVPRLGSSPFAGVPYPLSIEIVQGQSDIFQVIKDVLALTKLNYNGCQFADGMPITLNFAEKIGDILTSAPIEKDAAPLPFKFYI